MRLAVSNLAWPAGADAAVAPLLIEHGFAGVEVAPFAAPYVRPRGSVGDGSGRDAVGDGPVGEAGPG